MIVAHCSINPAPLGPVESLTRLLSYNMAICDLAPTAFKFITYFKFLNQWYRKTLMDINISPQDLALSGSFTSWMSRHKIKIGSRTSGWLMVEADMVNKDTYFLRPKVSPIPTKKKRNRFEGTSSMLLGAYSQAQLPIIEVSSENPDDEKEFSLWRIKRRFATPTTTNLETTALLLLIGGPQSPPFLLQEPTQPPKFKLESPASQEQESQSLCSSEAQILKSSTTSILTHLITRNSPKPVKGPSKPLLVIRPLINHDAPHSDVCSLQNTDFAQALLGTMIPSVDYKEVCITYEDIMMINFCPSFFLTYVDQAHIWTESALFPQEEAYEKEVEKYIDATTFKEIKANEYKKDLAKVWEELDQGAICPLVVITLIMPRASQATSRIIRNELKYTSLIVLL
ncbi:S ribonuclease [Pyrus ussuriensis x Pyrus communis]|uniref:S ribonuclease n=1 Tax=Pyrus ussuriensis x Pyrus communis TaxID=2448454 RepID=A0A5N5IBH6_9ROSA|nr:S ribonuclease [Pyrus ussuriensis x Pyrus communis]